MDEVLSSSFLFLLVRATKEKKKRSKEKEKRRGTDVFQSTPDIAGVGFGKQSVWYTLSLSWFDRRTRTVEEQESFHAVVTVVDSDFHRGMKGFGSVWPSEPFLPGEDPGGEVCHSASRMAPRLALVTRARYWRSQRLSRGLTLGVKAALRRAISSSPRRTSRT